MPDKIKYIVQHLEPTLSPWVCAEYAHIALRIPKERVVFTLLSPESLPAALEGCIATDKSVEEFVPAAERDSVCLLDEEAPSELAPSDESWIRYVLVGGILGDEDVDESYRAVDRDRTRELRRLGFPSRHLGDAQMTLDHAAIVAMEILERGKTLEGMDWVDRPWFKVGEHEQIQIPFRYLPLPDDETPPPDLVAAMPKGAKLPMLAPGLLQIMRDDGSSKTEDEDDGVWG